MTTTYSGWSKILTEYILDPVMDFAYEWFYGALTSVLDPSYIPQGYSPEQDGRKKLTSYLFIGLVIIVAIAILIRLYILFQTITDS